MGAQTEKALRTDIQGMRALAVVLVVVYHLRAATLPGGFIGVDVFFVISGFLITSHLVSRPPSGATDLAAFWGRRIRRLLPASLLVLLASVAATRWLAPETMWEATASDARAAALYVVNWALAGRAVDYLSSDDAPTAVQHFWSLSVEEQFYFFWPLVVAGIALLARRRGLSTRTLLLGAFGAITAGSLAWSIHLTNTNPAAAYFVTPTRVWELGAGGLLAVLVTRESPRGQRASERRSVAVLRPLGAWAGLALITWSALTYTAATPFPGYQAGAPVLGAVLVLGCTAPVGDRFGPGRLLALAPVQWLGNVSYSIYLWHWPLIVLTIAHVDHPLGPRTGAAVVVATLVLAGLTERYVERPFRRPPRVNPLRRTYAVGVLAMGVVVALTTVQLVEVDGRAEDSAARRAMLLEEGGPCLGAAALSPGADCPPVAYADLIPSAIAAGDDRPDAHGDIDKGYCRTGESHFRNVTCNFGDEDSPVKISLFGNSHAGQWLPTLQSIVADHGWQLETNIASRCAAADLPQKFQRKGSSENCLAWVHRITDSIVAERPDLVVFTNKYQAAVRGYSLEDSEPLYVGGYQRILSQIVDAGVPVLVIRDTPDPGFDVPACVAEHPDDLSACDGSLRRWESAEPAIKAVEAIDSPLLRLVDLTDRFCDAERCRAVNGGVITYFDANHMTVTYARTLAPYLEPAVLRSLGKKS